MRSCPERCCGRPLPLAFCGMASQLWIDMLEQRNLMAHTYDVKRAQRALVLIRGTFAPALRSLAQNLEQRP